MKQLQRCLIRYRWLLLSVGVLSFMYIGTSQLLAGTPLESRDTVLTRLYQRLNHVRLTGGGGGGEALFSGVGLDQRSAPPGVLPRAQNRGFKLFAAPDMTSSCHIQASINEKFDKLEKATRGDWHWQWMMKRIRSMWGHWVEAAQKLEEKWPSMRKRKLKKIMVAPGVLTQTDYAREATIKAGGPLGDLLQWADIIAGLHVLGHHVDLHHNLFLASTHLLRNDFRGGPAECHTVPFQSIFVDILGFKVLSPDIQNAFRCKFRVIDAYGTHVMFNHPSYALHHGYKSPYGGLGLNLKQFYTFYPHTPDNSFMGFAVQPVTTKPKKKKQMALLYGKKPKYWRNGGSFVKEILKMNISVHATLPRKAASFLPKEVVFHDIVDSKTYQSLLGDSKYLLAPGSPLESSGVIEALNHGTVIIQPKYTGAQRSVLKGKPTSRKMTSQVPYLEEFVGPPHAYTIDVSRPADILEVVSETLQLNVTPKVPDEFTMEGFLLRLHAYLEHQNFCDSAAPLWPPLEALVPIQGQLSESCSDACMRMGREQNRTTICEPVYFKTMNSQDYILQHQLGKRDSPVSSSADVYYPALDEEDKEGRLILQADPSLFSCAGQRKGLRRLCPCRFGWKHQVALCDQCLTTDDVT